MEWTSQSRCGDWRTLLAQELKLPPGAPPFALPHARDKEKTHHTQASLPVKTRLRGKDELPQTERPPTSSPVVLPSMKMGGQTMSMLYWMWSSRSPPSWPSS